MRRDASRRRQRVGSAIVVTLLSGCAVTRSSPTAIDPVHQGEASAPEPISVAAKASEPERQTKESPASAVSSEVVLESLDVPGYLPSVLIAPPLTETRLPVVVVTHGAGGRPEGHCARYRELAQTSAFILCTRGRATNTHLPVEERGYFYDGHVELGRELVSALQALSDRYGKRVDATNVTFAGFSQGASMGILYLQQGGAHEAHVRRILLVEGGSVDWYIAAAQKLKEDGVEKIAFVCGQVSCHEGAERSEMFIRRTGLDVLSLYARGAGHTDEGAVRPLVDQAWTWLTH